MHFSRAAGNNLLFSPPTRTEPHGWGGHRVWLGPQSSWSSPWPPPAAWEHSAAERVTIDKNRLEFAIPPASDGWPSFTRVYRWEGERLHCGVAIAAGGTRDFQVVHIVQMPVGTEITARLLPKPGSKNGYIGLPRGGRSAAAELTEPPPQAVIEGHLIRLTHRREVEKLGFVPQPLLGRIGETTLQVNRGAFTGSAISEPDGGFFTQVYLGAEEPFVELEQLSPLWKRGTAVAAEIILEGK